MNEKEDKNSRTRRQGLSDYKTRVKEQEGKD